MGGAVARGSAEGSGARGSVAVGELARLRDPRGDRDGSGTGASAAVADASAGAEGCAWTGAGTPKAPAQAATKTRLPGLLVEFMLGWISG
jgi:hypothetical protein